MGNHELWDGTNQTDWANPDYVPRSIDEIVRDYTATISRGWLSKESSTEIVNWSERLPGENYVHSIILENAVFVRYKDEQSLIIREEDIINASDEELTDLMSMCTFVILGGIGYSGLNPTYNAEIGLYRRAMKSVDEDRCRSERFRKVYDKICLCAKDRKVIVFTHTPVEDWTDEPCVKNWIYVNGHTHQNALSISEDGPAILSDNQVGYKPRRWKLNSFEIDNLWYDPFEKYNDGIYEITSEQYKEFNLGRGIMSKGCNYEGRLYMLKREKMYMFVLQSSRSLCLMVGGQRKRLPDRGVRYYYDNMQRYGECVKSFIKPYQELMLRISNEVKRFGGWGKVHGCIVDIGFYTHIYVNPYDGKISFYFAWDTMSRKPYQNVQKLFESEEPQLLGRFVSEYQKNKLPLLGKAIAEEIIEGEDVNVPEWVLGNELYKPSRIMKAIQYVWSQNVIRIWNDEVLRNEVIERKRTLLD